MKKNKYALPVPFFQHDSNMNGAQVIQGSFASIYKRYEKNEPYVGESIFSEHLTSWKNERVYAHLILWSQTDAETLSYEVTPMKRSKFGRQLISRCLSRFTGYWPVWVRK